MKNFNFCNLENADITIITLTYNSCQYITKCLESIINSCHHLHRFKVSHLVIDGFSQDATKDIIEEVSPSTLVFCKQPAGIYDALNYAVSLVKSPYVMYVHSDDEIDEYFLTEMFQVMEQLKDNQSYLLYGTVDFINEDSQILFSRKPPFFISAFQKEVPLIFHPNAIYSTAVEKSHPYSLNSGLDADQKHIIEIASKTILVRVPSARYRFRMSRASSTMIKLSESTNQQNYALSLPRIYIRLFENKLIERLIMKLNNKSYWR
ncbi:glycosyltransferase [Chrysosporum bergii ANA360D]|uniref:Glycosyltransferase n=1 Tax=Chrysosporum bergii ANA360D TaxID=617107 RepID=A0AA43GPR6_9CYAN|nr:glycosyltransferase [Chrysosporum bergii]MDH6059467.1 glycosyltransferase [Chrysosporum bergii ANA360D]